MESTAKTPVLPERKFLPHSIPTWVEPNAVFFVTVCCTPRTENQLCHSIIADALFETIEFRQNRGDWFVHLLLFMPDHVHGLISFPRDRDMRKVVGQWKEIVAKKHRIAWQRDFFDHRLRTRESYEEKAHYIRMNPVRRGLAGSPASWPFIWESRQG